MNLKKVASSASQLITDPFETLTSQVAKPIFDETVSELGSFFGAPKNLSQRPKSIGEEELTRARNEQKLQDLSKKDQQNSKDNYTKIIQEYKSFDTKSEKHQQALRQEVVELQEEVVKLAKASGVDTKAHIENVPKKVGTLHIKVLTSVIRTLRIKAEEPKSAKDLVVERQNVKRTTGMLAWVSGKQMKVHEQGTLTLQG